MMKIIKVGKRYTTVVFTETIYSCGRVMYMENEEYLIPNGDVEMLKRNYNL